MIARNKQKRRSKFRILLALPLTALLTVCFSFTERPIRQSGLTETADTEQPYSPNNGESPQRFSDSTNRASSDTSIFGQPRPLILIDGKEVDNIKGLNPNDVETVSVLKDPTLVGVYGDRGKNGVILIKTKSRLLTPDRPDKPARNPEENEKPEK